LNKTAKLFGLSLLVANSAFERKNFVVRVIAASIDSLSFQIFLTLLDTVIVSWSKINAYVGEIAEQATHKSIIIFVVIKYLIVYTVILGYIIVVVGGWSLTLNLVWTLMFSISILGSAISFLVLFVVMGYKTTALTNRKLPSNIVRNCFEKVR
jgi:hypothetical protein